MEMNKFFQTVDMSSFKKDENDNNGVRTVLQDVKAIKDNSLEDVITKNMILSGKGLDLLHCGPIKTFKKNGLELSYYGGDLSTAEFNGKNLEELFNIQKASCLDDELCYRITNEAVDFIIKIASAPTPEFAQEIFDDYVYEGKIFINEEEIDER